MNTILQTKKSLVITSLFSILLIGSLNSCAPKKEMSESNSTTQSSTTNEVKAASDALDTKNTKMVEGPKSIR